jgi:DNA-binding response OmpR family regulator
MKTQSGHRLASEDLQGGILVIEDDRRVAEGLVRGLAEAGFNVRVAASLKAAKQAIAAIMPRLMILDLGLPDGDGLTFLRELRRFGASPPVIILTARDSVGARVEGLDVGADDYLVKPFSFPELLARVRARLRNVRQVETPETLCVADLEIDRLNRHVRRAGVGIELTAKEFDVLVFMAQAEGSPVSRDMLTREVWKLNSRVTLMDNVIDVHISRLREKIDHGHERKLIRTLRGVGFVLEGDGT